jgi:hypothetical protein
LEVGPDRLNEGNYLAFAVACRWLSRLVYVAHPGAGEDLMWLHFRHFEPGTNALQVKPCTPRQLKEFLSHLEENPPYEPLEPEVPFSRVSGDQFSTKESFSFAVLCHSHFYTPRSADALVPVIMDFIAPI